MQRLYGKREYQERVSANWAKVAEEQRVMLSEYRERARELERERDAAVSYLRGLGNAEEIAQFVLSLPASAAHRLGRQHRKELVGGAS